MIHYKKKDITTVDMGVVVHGVNCMRKMGSGVAKAIKEKWPEIYEKYMASPGGNVMLGSAQFICIKDDESLWVGNLYTQLMYGYGGGKYASPDAIRSSLRRAYVWTDLYDLTNLYMPKIGCGLGGLDWEEDVEPIVEELDEAFERVETIVCEL